MRKLLPLLLAALTGCIYGRYERRTAVQPPPPVAREEAERLLAAGLSESVILEVVDSRGTRHLSPEDIVALKKAGAGDRLLEKMIAAERAEPRVVVLDSPAYYYVDPYWAWPGYGYYRSSYWSYGGWWGWRRCGW